MRRTSRDIGARAARGRAAPVWLRVGMLAAAAALLAHVIGGADGFWIGLPAVLLAAGLGSSGGSALGGALTVVACSAVGAVSAPGVPLPPVWLMLAVPAACSAVVYRRCRRLRRERDAMEHAAHSDPLTGLANRRRLLTVATHEIARHRRSGERLAVVMLDLDGFKLLNDRYGHAAGDRMLCDVGAALAEALRAQDTVARLGGDEFCVLAPATRDVRGLSEKLAAAVADAGRGYEELRVSLGVAAYPQDGDTIGALMEVADARLLSVKRRRHGTATRRAA